MVIKDVLSESKDSKEADVIVSDGHFDLCCFAHPFHQEIGYKLIKPLYCFDAHNMFISLDSMYMIKKLPLYYSYLLRGKLLDKSKQIIRIGDIKIIIDSNIPGDAKVGDFLEFMCERVDFNNQL